MLAITRITGPLTENVESFPIEDFKDVPYSPVFLIPVCLGPSIVAHFEYTEACEYGFNSYFESMCVWEDDENMRFESRSYAARDVIGEVVMNLADDPTVETSLAWRVGILVGWLSALALADRPLALKGRDLLVTLATQQTS